MRVRSTRASRRWRLAPPALLLTLVAACGGGSDSPTGPPNPPPPAQTVASVTVTPSTATLIAPETVQLTATPRDAQGNVMTTTVTWTTSSSAVASVSQGGLVTSVGAGTATITASAGGQSGSALITVTVQPTSPYGPVVEKKDIGPAGGTLGNADIAVTIPAGVLLTARPIEVVRDTSTPTGLIGQAGGPRYVIDGLPSSQVTTLTVRVRPNGTVTGTPAIALQQLAVDQGDTVATVLGLRVLRARDSAGFLVAEVAIRGREGTPFVSPFGAARSVPVTPAAAFDPASLMADGFLTALLNVRVRTSLSGRFDVWNGLDDPNADANLSTVGGWMDEAYATLTGTYGYSAAHRAVWPMQVLIENSAATYNGVFRQFAPYPFDNNYSVIGMPRGKLTRGEQPGTAIHELYHFMQQRYRDGLTPAQYNGMSWLMEATSTWMSEFHPKSPRPFRNSTAESWRENLYIGLRPDMNAEAGYGKAPLIKYAARQWGHEKIRDAWGGVLAGKPSVGALLDALPEPAAQWWPAVLTQQLGGSLYAWPTDSILPEPAFFPIGIVPARPGRQAWASANALWPLEVAIWRLERDTAMFGPQFQLPVYLDTASVGKIKLLAFEKPAAAAYFRPIAGTDTVFIPGHRLQSRDTILLLSTSVDVTPPYTVRHKSGVRVDLRLPDGDWYVTKVSDVTDNFRYVCDNPGDSVRLDPAENADDVIGLLAGAGTWKRKATPSYPATYEWAVSPAYADSLRTFGITLTSTIRESAKDTVYVSARMQWDLLNDPRIAPIRDRIVKGDLGGWWWWLLPIGLVPIARSKRARRALPMAALALVVLVAGCVGIGIIGFEIDESIELAITKVRYTADPAAPNAPLLEVREGRGTTTLTKLRTEVWLYTYDEDGAKADSTRQACTGSGTATYAFTGTVYADGVKPPDIDDDEDPIVSRIERAFNVPGLAKRVADARAAEARAIRP